MTRLDGMQENPCRYCERRRGGCCVTCEEWKKWKAEYERKRIEELEARLPMTMAKFRERYIRDTKVGRAAIRKARG